MLREWVREKLKHNAAFVQLPIGLESKLTGLVDLVKERAIYFDGDNGEIVRYDAIPGDMMAEVKAYRQEMIEHISDADEIVGNMFLEEKVPSMDDLMAGIRRSCINRTFTPVLVGNFNKDNLLKDLISNRTEK